MGRSKQRIILNLLAVGFVTIGLPWIIGLEFLSAFVLIPLACLSVFLVADLVIDSFISYPGGLDSREFAGKAIACVALGWIFGVTMIVTGLVGLNVLNRFREFLLPTTAVVMDAVGLSLAASILVAGVALRVTWRASTAGPAKLAMKAAIVSVTLLCMYGCNQWQTDGSFLLTAETLGLISAAASAGMLIVGVALLALPIRLRR